MIGTSDSVQPDATRSLHCQSSFIRLLRRLTSGSLVYTKKLKGSVIARDISARIAVVSVRLLRSFVRSLAYRLVNRTNVVNIVVDKRVDDGERKEEAIIRWPIYDKHR